MEFDKEAISRDISLVKNISDEEIERIIKFLHDSKDNDGINLSKVEYNIDEIVNLNDDYIDAIFSLFFSISQMYSLEVLPKYQDFLKEHFSTDEKKISDIINKLVELEIPFEINKYEQIDQLLHFGLPHLSSFGIMTDYRMLNLRNKKQMLPVIIFNMLLHDAHDDDDIDKKIVFQLTPTTLKNFISKLQDFERKIDKELSLISIRDEGE
jgi:hypothetical protein